MKWVILTLLLAMPPSASAQRAESEMPMILSPVPIPLVYQLRWLDEVAPFITEAEREAYLALDDAGARTLFQREFWRSRDPTVRTRLNEKKEQYLHHLVATRGEGLEPAGERARLRLLFGPPDSSYQHGDCEQPQEDLSAKDCFTGPTFELAGYEATADREAVAVVLAADGEDCRLVAPERRIRVRLKPQTHCLTDTRLQRLDGQVKVALRERPTWTELAELGLKAPPQRAWLGDFSKRVSADSAVVPRLQVGSAVPAREGKRRRRGDPRMLELNAALEIPLRDDWWRHPTPWRILFVRSDVLVGDRFVASSDARRGLFARPEENLRLPIRLRVSEDLDQTVVVHVEDEAGELYETAAFEILSSGDRSVEPAEPQRVVAMEEGGQPSTELPRFEIAPLHGLRLGSTQVRVRASGLEVFRVEYRLAGVPAGQSSTPPFHLEIDLGEVPRERSLEAIGYDRSGAVIATDQWTLNPGASRFRLQLADVSDLSDGMVYLRARVEVPIGATLERVELFEGEELVAAGRSPRLEYRRPETQDEAAGRAVAVFRAVAHLADGRTTSDTRLVTRTPLEEVEVNLVEVFASVRDPSGALVTDLQSHEVTVFEEGREHRVKHFERVENLPLNLVLLLDVSATMKDEIETVRQSAVSFMERMIREDDRAALVVFSGIGYAAAPFTNDLETLREASRSLTAWGGTALWDSTTVSLYYLLGLEGKSALVLLSDGLDRSSSLGFRATLEFAERTGIAVYTVGTGLPTAGDPSAGEARRRLRRLANRTGGRYYSLTDIGQLPEIYAQIESDLRSQYLLVYESSGATDADSYRAIRLEVARPGVRVEARPGYYP